MSAPAIRRAKTGDLPEIEALVDAAYRPWIAVIGTTPGPMLDDYAVAISDGVVDVVDDAQGLAAMLILRDRDDALLLENVAVHPRAQGRGLGRILMLRADEVARARGFARVILYTHARMTSNIALYERAGFLTVETRHERGLERVYMEKRLG